MADEYFEGLWDEVVLELKDVFSSDRRFLKTKVFPEREKAYNTLQTNYIRYVGIVNKLGECYSQIIQPQERLLVKKMLDCCVGRLVEIKHELVEVEKTDFIYMDNILLQMKKTIMDLEIEVPEYYRTDRIEKIDHIDTVIAQAIEEKAAADARLLEQSTQEERRPSDEEQGGEEADRPPEGTEGDQEVTPVFDDSSRFARRSRAMSKRVSDDQKAKRPKFKVVELTEEEKAYRAAVFLIQKHERARTARLTTQIARERIRLMEDIAWLRHKPIPEDVKLKVSRVIQRYWARYKMRRHQSFKSVSRNLIMGLLEPSYQAGNETRQVVEELGANRRIAQKEALKAMEDAAIVAKLRMEKNSDRICDSIADELRYFIYTWYKFMEAAGYPKLPEWPDPTPIIPGPFVHGIPKDCPDGLAEKFIKSVVNTLAGLEPEPIGGSALITAGHWIPVDVYALLIEQIEKSKNKGKTEKKKPSKKELKEKLKKEKEAEAKRLADLKKEGFVPTPSKFAEYLDRSMRDFFIDWKDRDVSRSHNQAMVDLDVAKNLQLELRLQVDEDMKLELERLQNAINADRGLPPIVKKEPKQKPKKRGRRKKKDPTGNMTEDEIVADLAIRGLIAPYKRWFFIDLPGAHSLANYEARKVFFEDPPPQWGDFKQVVKEYCVLHLGSNFTHLRAPLVRSVLICGPMQIIQEYADVICTESGAVKFTLDPLAMPLSSYKKKLFDHMFTKIPRMLKPSVIFIPGAEKVFYKNVPKDEKELNPKALGKILPKLVKSIKPGDQILVLGISDQPWAATANQMTKTFDKVLCFPDCDYQSLNQFWSDRLFKYHGVNRYFNVPVLTNMTRGYGLKELEEKLADNMTPERIMSLKYKPLKESELCLDLPTLETDKKKPQPNAWEWSQKSVKMYIQRRNALQVEAAKRAKLMKGANKPDKKKQKKKEIKERLIVENRLLSRASDRPQSSCCPWAPERQKDAIKYYYNLKSSVPPPKTDLYRNEKSLDEFPIRKPIL